MITGKQKRIIWDRNDARYIRKINLTECLYKKLFVHRIGFLLETVASDLEVLWLDINHVDNLKYAEEKVFFMYNVRGLLFESVEDAAKAYDLISKSIMWEMLNE
jgi:hypothetical protein